MGSHSLRYTGVVDPQQPGLIPRGTPTRLRLHITRGQRRRSRRCVHFLRAQNKKGLVLSFARAHVRGREQRRARAVFCESPRVKDFISKSLIRSARWASRLWRSHAFRTTRYTRRAAALIQCNHMTTYCPTDLMDTCQCTQVVRDCTSTFAFALEALSHRR